MMDFELLNRRSIYGSVEEKEIRNERATLIRGIGLGYVRLISNHSRSSSVSVFSSELPPSMTINDYVSRIGVFSRCSNEAFVIAVIYVDRIILGTSPLEVNAKNVHRLFLSSIRVANKFHDDESDDNRSFSEIGGIELNELNRLEEEFLSNIKYQLFVDRSEYEKYKEKILKLGKINQHTPDE